MNTNQFEKGNDLIDAGEFDKAHKIAEHLISSGIQAKGHALRARCYLFQENYTSARDEYLKSVAIDNNSATSFYNLGICYQNLEEFDEAIKFFTKTLELDPDEGDAAYNRGWCLHSLGKTEESIADYLLAEKLDTIESTLHLNIATQYAAIGEQQLSREYYNKAKALAKDELKEAVTDALLQVIYEASIELNEIEEALKDFSKILESSPGNPWALYYTGCIHLGNRDLDIARDIFEEALKAGGGDEVKRELGRTLYELGHFSESEKLLREVLETQTNDPTTLGYLGICLTQTEDQLGAIDAYELARKHGHSDFWILSGLALCYINIEDFESALTVYTDLFNDFGDTELPYEDYYNLGYCYCSCNDFEKAIDVLQKGLSLNQDDLECYYLLGYCYASLGDFDLTLIHMQKYVQMLALEHDSYLEVPQIQNFLTYLDDVGQSELADEIRNTTIH